MEASIWFDLVNTSTHVETRSQQFDYLDQYVMSDRMSATTSVKIVVYLPLSAIVMGGLTLPVHSYERLEATARSNPIMSNGKLVDNGAPSHCGRRASITTKLHPSRQNLLLTTSQLNFFWLHVQSVPS